MLESVGSSCPYCGAPFRTVVEADSDADGSTVRMIDDCGVCCQPVVVELHIDTTGAIAGVRLARDDE